MPPRPIRPKDDVSLAEDVEATSSDAKSSKRRAVSSACIPCRRRKSKCDGNVPACSTCIAVYRTECSYDADSDHRRKGALKRDIQSLRQRNDALHVIVDSLKALPEPDAIALLRSLRNDADPDMLASSLQTNFQLPGHFAAQTLEADFAQHQPLPAHMNSESTSSSQLSPSLSRAGSEVARQDVPYAMDQSSWFSTPTDPELVEHLINLYFSWINPFHRLISQEHFLHDMRTGRTDFCSALLLNAILAFASHYSDRPQVRSDPANPLTAGDDFFAEAARILNMGGRTNLVTVQALGVMGLRQGSKGHDSDAYQLGGRCIRSALELGLHLSVVSGGAKPLESEVRRVTFWGVFNMETVCSVGIGRLSLLPRAAADTEKPAVNDRFENQTWIPHEDTALSSKASEQPARQNVFTQCLSNLSELASDMVNTFYAPRERFTSRRLATTYSQYQDWFRNLPDCFRLENTSLPHVFVMHMYYYTCVLHLFRPYIKLDLHEANLYPRETCTFCANEISTLMNTLKAMYGLRRTGLTVTALLLAASTIHLLNLPDELAATYLCQAMHDLQAMSVNHPFAVRCVDIIRALAKKWNIVLPDEAPPAPRKMSEQFAPPLTTSFYASSIPQQHAEGGNSARSSEHQSSGHDQPFPPDQSQMSSFYSDPATPLDHIQAQTMFWTPFPTQGMPTRPEMVPPSAYGLHFSNFHHVWPGFVENPEPDSSYLSQRHHSAPDRTEDASSGSGAPWNWQG